MTEIKVGDRVRVYEGAQVIDGTVKIVMSGFISFEEGGIDTPVRVYHPKQCRRLKKKERRRVWIHENAARKNRIASDGWVVSLEYPTAVMGPGPWVEFSEVRRGK